MLIMVKFCPKCGKKIKTGIFCKDCEEKPLLENFKEFTVRICMASQRYFLKNRWHPYSDPYEPYIKTAKYYIKTKPGVLLKVKPIEKNEKIRKLLIEAIDSEGNSEEYIIPIKVDKTESPEAQKRTSGYLEGTLQVRNLTEFTFIVLREELARAEKNYVHATKVVEKKDSMDLEMTSQHEIERIARNMQQKCGGKLKIDYKLQTRDHLRSKDLYRITATITLPKFNKGEVIKFDDAPHLIKSLSKTINTINLITGQKAKIDFEETYHLIPKQETTISKLKPQLEVLDPETYQSEPLVCIAKVPRMKENVTLPVVKFKKVLYYVG